ncbi:retrotransposon protein, putative, ty1-copia subclass [Tanacetum coccineum]
MAQPDNNNTLSSALKTFFEREKLTGDNFNDWYRSLRIVLRVAGTYDYLYKPCPDEPPANAAENVKAAWKAEYKIHSDVACLMLGKMSPALQRQFELYFPQAMLNELRKMFEKPPAVEIYDLVDTLHSCKQAPGKSVSAHVLEMKGYMDQLQALGKPYDNDMAINLINRSLNKDFGDFVRNFNMHCVGKTVSDLHALLIDFEKGLKDKAPTPQVLAIQKGRVNKPKPQANKKGKGKGKADKNKQVVAYQPKPKQNPPQKKENPKKDQACHHCNVVGHWKRNCPLYLEELRTNKNKKAEHGAATSGNLFMIELFNLTHKLNSWVYDTGCGIHICNTLQGFRVERKLSYGEQYLHVGNGAQAAVEAIGVFNLVLPSGLVLSLNNCHYAPSIIRGVVSFSCLLDLGFVHTVTSNGISVSSNGIFYFSAISVNGVFEIDMNDNVSKYNNNSIFSINKKRKLDLNSSYLWHCRLAHIGKTRMQKLQREGLLESINDESYDKCESCISGKMTKKPFNNNIERATDLLGLIHTDVCGPLRHVSRKGASYFLTFTDDFSRYGYVYLLKHKHEVFETFKVFKSEVELQLGKKIKALRSDRGGEYLSQEFKEYLGKNGIVQHLTSPYTPQQNGVSERRNRTLLDMVRSMFNLTTLPLSFWDYALESAIRILNMVPTKKVDMTPYEIWHVKVRSRLLCVRRMIVRASVIVSAVGQVEDDESRGILAEPANYRAAMIDPDNLMASSKQIRASRILNSHKLHTYNYEIWQIDVKTAFLNGRLDEDIYKEQPEDEEKAYKTRVPYLRTVDLSFYLLRCTRPDVAFGSKLGQLGINIIRGSPLSTGLPGFCDSVQAMTIKKIQSLRRLCPMFVNGGAVTKSKKQTPIAMHATQTEYMAMAASRRRNGKAVFGLGGVHGSNDDIELEADTKKSDNSPFGKFLPLAMH